ncbi:MAG: hypothetical protein MUO89_08040, partial [Dehalococcoidia bacterium]|nr:hypothetical protein [Dehalococcoidia bacterium]
QEIDAESPANLSKYDRICFCFRGVVYLAEVVEVHQQIVKPGFPWLYRPIPACEPHSCPELYAVAHGAETDNVTLSSHMKPFLGQRKDSRKQDEAVLLKTEHLVGETPQRTECKSSVDAYELRIDKSLGHLQEQRQQCQEIRQKS